MKLPLHTTNKCRQSTRNFPKKYDFDKYNSHLTQGLSLCILGKNKCITNINVVNLVDL